MKNSWIWRIYCYKLSSKIDKIFLFFREITNVTAKNLRWQFTWNWREIWTWRVSTDCDWEANSVICNKSIKNSQQVSKNTNFNSADLWLNSWKITKTRRFFREIGLSFATPKKGAQIPRIWRFCKQDHKIRLVTLSILNRV